MADPKKQKQQKQPQPQQQQQEQEQLQQQQLILEEQQKLIKQQQKLLQQLQQQNQQAEDAAVRQDIYGYNNGIHQGYGYPPLYGGGPGPPYPLPPGPLSQFRPAPLDAFPPIPGVPIGLEPLASIDCVHVVQELEEGEIVFGVETENRYDVLNENGQRIFFAGEKSDFCNRRYLKWNRPFVLYLFDSQGKVAVTMERACNFTLRCWGAKWGGTVLVVKSGFTGELYGTVSQSCDYCTPRFDILDHEGKQILEIAGPCGGSGCCCTSAMSGDAEFGVFLAESELDPNQAKDQKRPMAGEIIKKFTLKEIFSDANTFGIRFNPDLDPRTKVVLLGATFAIDFAFFEEGTGEGTYAYRRRRRQGRRGDGPGLSNICRSCAWSICTGVVVFIISFPIVAMIGWGLVVIITSPPATTTTSTATRRSVG